MEGYSSSRLQIKRILCLPNWYLDFNFSKKKKKVNEILLQAKTFTFGMLRYLILTWTLLLAVN